MAQASDTAQPQTPPRRDNRNTYRVNNLRYKNHCCKLTDMSACLCTLCDNCVCTVFFHLLCHCNTCNNRHNLNSCLFK